MFVNLHPVSPQSVEILFRCFQSADRVVHQADFHPRLPPLDQDISQLTADSVVVENKGFNVDMVPGGSHCSEHRCESCGTILQQFHPVAGNQRAVGNPLLDPQHILHGKTNFRKGSLSGQTA